MELLEGSRLATPLPLDRLDDVARQLVRGLAALHAAGVVHRDFKTSNIILVGERAVITDFGLARSMDDSDAKLTLDSGLLGTPAYMSPEQVEGRPATPASDVYALGVVLFELLTGRLPFVEDTAMAAATARLLRDPPRPSSVRTGVPARWDAIVLRCLARDPSARPTIDQVLAPVGRSRRWVLGAWGIGAALVLGGVGIGRKLLRSEHALALPPKHVVAVLPVGDVATLFADPVRTAITIDLHDLLTTVGFPVVDIYSQAMDQRLRGPAMRWAETKDPVAAALHFAHVARVVQPTLVRDGTSVELVLTTTLRDQTIVTQRFTRPLAEVSQLAHDAARTLTRDVGFGPPRWRDPSLTSAQYERYGVGLADLFRDLTEVEVEAMKQAGRGPLYNLRVFSDEVPAHARAAAILAGREQGRAGQQEVFEETTKFLARASKYVDRALAADPDQALAHAVRGHAAMLAWNWKLADEETRRGVELAPTHARVVGKRTFLLQLQGRFDELLASAERELPLDDRLGDARLGYYYYYTRRFEEAIRVMAPKIDNFDFSNFVECVHAATLALAYAELGRYDDALAVARKLWPKLENYARAGLIPVYVLAGRVDEAKTLRDEAYAAGLDLGQQALVDDAFGDHEAALAKLEQVVASHNVHALFLKIDRYSSALRAEPRFHALMQKVGFL